MPKSVDLLRVFIASPDDTNVERVAVREIIELINKSDLIDTRYYLEAVMFETDVTPGFSTDPQSVINEQVGDNYDIFIGMLKGKFGTPTPRAGSGTEEEFRRAYNRWQGDNRNSQIMFYFGNQDVYTSQLDTKDLMELMKVKNFQEEVSGLGGVYHAYKDIQGFRESLRSHLVRKIRTFGKEWGPVQNDSIEAFPQSDAPLEEPTLIDLGADAEEAMETLGASVQRMTTALTMLGSNVSKRAAEAERLKRQRGVSAKRIRGFMRATADDITASRTSLGNEMPVYTSSWSLFKDSVLEIISRAQIKSDDDRAAIKELSANLQKYYTALQTSLDSTKGLRETATSLQGNKDLNRSARELGETLDIFNRESTSMMTEISDIQSGLDGMLT